MSSEARRILRRSRDYYRENGARKVGPRAAKKLGAYLAYPLELALHRSKTFEFQGRRYPYFIHHYNSTWSNERAVEIAIAKTVIATADHPILEVGNVLSHYLAIDHEVIDKYEVAPNVHNLDVVDLQATTGYGLIISISTLEHVGWDEHPRVPDKVGRAIKTLRAALKDGGEIFLTCPLGHNPYLDELICTGLLNPLSQSFLTRSGRRGNWVETAAPPSSSGDGTAVWVARLAAE